MTENFDELLKSRFQLSHFRPGQKEIICSILQNRDVLAVLPTGGGKSLCFQFPALYKDQLVIVVSPLIALMKDQVQNLLNMGLRAGAIFSGQSEAEKRQVFSDINQSGAYILYLSPERVQKEGFQTWIQKRKIALFAIDEAHCVSQWGHDFRAEYSQLHILKTLRPDVPTLALTASATPTVLSDISKQIKLHKPERRVHGFYRPNLYYQVEICENEDKKDELLRQAIAQSLERSPTGRIIVYSGTRRRTEELAAELQNYFQQVGFYHAGLSPLQRSQTQEAYQQGNLRILVATNAFGMGIDQPDVRLVVHYHMPATIDALYQEMGRAGRDGKNSTCLMLYAAKDKGLQSYFIQSSSAPADIKNARWKNLEALVNYSEGSECRHAEILTYYQDNQRIERCGHCDSCLPQSDRRIRLRGPSPLTKIKKHPATSNNLKKTKISLNEVLNQEQEELFQKLRAWRKQKAVELDLPAFVVFSDRTLRELAVRHPLQMSNLQEVHGIGEEKMERFGADLLLILKDGK